MGSDIKESIGVKANVGVVSVDDIDGTTELITEQVLKAAGALKSRGITSAKLTLTFKANIES